MQLPVWTNVILLRLETPEGKSIIELGRETGRRMRDLNTTGARMI